ncbi:putative septum site-determining protein MinC [Selenomonas ruminantium subsp. lactilytica TAM6421]|uniref:Probable septum site-determining protein MinC n=1 Tax=Selenomonas ruminantium subsp. lactilytica (strain NBRC 103574 / TAM6421) TaxID=927704 RepID=I0GTM1_SELRL|nr:septum site-determining protein MinC [Selenomonas ruminantium]BAL84108.1 putative septum site-determining protein MinC [Selenomonas ruminantium subsp. lactilytica TAM6421]
MSEDIVKIKGTSLGLQLSFAPEASFEDVRENLRQKLESGTTFFLRGTLVLIPRDVFMGSERDELQHLFHEYGLICRTQKPEAEKVQKPETKAPAPTPQPASPPVNEPEDLKPQEMVVVNKTLRGGQEIRTKSSVLVCGNVNPGAQIIAGGSIDIRGTCRGMVHAGAYGDSTAFIIADHLMPTQIRISNLIARSPDEMEKTDRAERASIKDGQIVIEPIERQDKTI